MTSITAAWPVRADTPATRGDLDAIAAQISGLSAVAGARNWITSVIGPTADYFTVSAWRVATGRIFEPGQERAGNAVCLIGATVKT